MRSLSGFMSMLAVDAPMPVLTKQLEEVERIAREVDALVGTSLFEDGGAVLSDPGKLMRLYTLFQGRQASGSDSE
jgi:hypothetical protein